ncbi:MAG: SAM-dependent methyltransferase, partial [Phycisphaerales bacterium JB041]
GAASVYSVDTAYGQFAWKLRNDDRVTVIERTNALHAVLPDDLGEGVDLVVIDLGWTKQERAIPAALRWLGPEGRIVSLIKPHYETPRQRVTRGQKAEPLDDDTAERVAQEVAARMPDFGVRVIDMVPSPIRGGKAGKGAAKGNVEFLILLARA